MISRIVIPVPVAGEGALVDTSILAGPKTVVLTGRFEGAYELLGSQDDSHFVPILQFDAGGVEGVRLAFDGAFKSMRVRAATPTTAPAGTVTCVVSATTSTDNHFATLATLAAGTAAGPGAIVDLAAIFPPTGPEADLCFLCEGGLLGSLTVLGSQDGVGFCPVGSFRRDRVPEGAPISTEFGPLPSQDKIRYVRLSLEGEVASAVVVTVGGNVPTQSSAGPTTAWWPLDELAYFFIDPDHGSDANLGYLIAAPGTVFTPAQAAAVAIKTTDRLEAIVPTYGAGRGYVILCAPRAGGAIYDASVEGDEQGGFRRDLRTGYSMEIMRGSDLTNSAADRSQVGMVTAYGPLTVATVGSNADGAYITCTAPAGPTPETMDRYRLRAVTGGGTYYAPIKWGDNPTPPTPANPALIRAWVPMWGPIAPGNTVYLEAPGVRLRNYFEAASQADQPSTFASPTANRLCLAGIEVGASNDGLNGDVYLGSNLGGGGLLPDGSDSSAYPWYYGVRASSPAKIVGSLRGSYTYKDETGTNRGVGGFGLDLDEGCTCNEVVDKISLEFCRLNNSVNLVSKQTSIFYTFAQLLWAQGGAEGMQIDNVLYQQITLTPRALCRVQHARWMTELLTTEQGILAVPDPGYNGSIYLDDISSFYHSEPAIPGIVLYNGQYETTLDLNTGITVGNGVRVLHAALGLGPAETIVTYASLGVTGFEVEGAQKVICLLAGVGYPSGILPCPRGLVMQMENGTAGTTYAPGLAVRASGADRFAIALADIPAHAAVLGYLATNVVQGDAGHDAGYAVVSSDASGVLQRDAASPAPAAGDLLYLSAASPGCFTTVVPSVPAELGLAEPVGPGATTSFCAVAWSPRGYTLSSIASTYPPTSGWAGTQAKRVAQLNQLYGMNLNGFWAQSLGIFPQDVAVTGVPLDPVFQTGLTQSKRAGGGWTVSNGGHPASWVWFSGEVLQDPSTEQWAVIGRCSFPTPVAGGFQLGLFGLVGTTAAGHGILVGECYDFGVHANYLVQQVTASDTGMVVDNNALHDFMLSFDLTTIRLHIDGALVWSSTDLSQLLSEPCHVGARGNTQTIDVTDIAFAFVRP